jgi:hypothetical protein
MLKFALFIFFISQLVVSLPAQQRILRYDILHNGEIKGALSLYQIRQAIRLTLK